MKGYLGRRKGLNIGVGLGMMMEYLGYGGDGFGCGWL